MRIGILKDTSLLFCCEEALVEIQDVIDIGLAQASSALGTGGEPSQVRESKEESPVSPEEEKAFLKERARSRRRRKLGTAVGQKTAARASPDRGTTRGGQIALRARPRTSGRKKSREESPLEDAKGAAELDKVNRRSRRRQQQDRPRLHHGHSQEPRGAHSPGQELSRSGSGRVRK